MNLLHTQMILRHYGSNRFKRDLIKPIYGEGCINKPRGGLWTSPINSIYGWKEWVNENSFGFKSLNKFFDLTFKGNVYVISNAVDLFKLPIIECESIGNIKTTDWNAVTKLGFDAIHLTTKGQIATRYTHPINLYGWDCESVLIINPKSIKLKI